MMFAHVLAALAAGFAAGADVAPPPAGSIWDLPEVEVRADALRDPMAPFPISGRRIGPEEVQRRAGGDLRDVLLPLAGLRVTSPGGPWAGSSVSLRGSTADQVLVLVDGRRWNRAQGGGVDLSTIALSSVESVDVFRGGASPFWGSEAIGGAILVHTRRADAGAWSVRLGSGSFGERSLAASAATTLPARGWRSLVTGQLFDTSGGYSYDDAARGAERAVQNGDVRRAQADLRADGGAGRFTVRADVGILDSERGVPGSAEFPTPSARLEDRRATAGLRIEDASSTRRPALDVSVLRQVRHYRENDEIFGPVDESHRNLRVEADAAAAGSRRSLAWRAAAGAATDRLDSTTDGIRRRDNGNARGQLSYDRRVAGMAVRWMLAARLDVTDGFAPSASPRAGVRIVPSPGRLAFSASAGTSYRTPSFDELFWAPRATAAGNPHLRGEHGRDLDLGVELGALPLRGALFVGAFVRDVDDLIQWIPGASGIWRPHNVGRVRISGAEAEGHAGAKLPRGAGVRISGSATLLEAVDRTGEPNVDGQRLPYRPQWSGAAAAVLTHPVVGELEAACRHIGDVYVTRANTKTLPGSFVVDVLWRRVLARGARVDAGVTNVGDVFARDFRDFPLPGRSWNLALTWERRPS
ncbi:MAG: TonB-dependent receptor plug domain-containing protein [Candidatus Eiseniibacteriota bacterium]